MYSFYHSRIKIIEREQMAAEGAESCARLALERVTLPELAGFWIHLDADVLNASIMPAVDSPNEAGITIAELTGLLGILLASPHAAGMHVTILDPARSQRDLRRCFC
ncbi:MAG: arginase family protein [Chthoniobacterales bacterium]|nr:arginase family protein [Chthoniobacterales bacterium]